MAQKKLHHHHHHHHCVLCFTGFSTNPRRLSSVHRLQRTWGALSPPPRATVWPVKLTDPAEIHYLHLNGPGNENLKRNEWDGDGRERGKTAAFPFFLWLVVLNCSSLSRERRNKVLRLHLVRTKQTPSICLHLGCLLFRVTFMAATFSSWNFSSLLYVTLTSRLSPKWREKGLFFKQPCPAKKKKKKSFDPSALLPAFPSVTYFLWGMNPSPSKQTQTSPRFPLFFFVYFSASLLQLLLLCFIPPKAGSCLPCHLCTASFRCFARVADSVSGINAAVKCSLPSSPLYAKHK